MVWMTSSSCKATTPPVHGPVLPGPALPPVASPPGLGIEGTLPMGSGNQLQKLLRIVQPVPEFGAERLGRKLCGNRKLAGSGIGGDELDFIDADGGILVVAERLLNLLGEVLRFRPAHGKSLGQASKVFDGDLIREQDAREPGGVQQLREAALGLSGFERDAVEKKFVVGDAEQKTGVAALGQCLLEFAPGALKLAFGPFVRHSIQPRVLDQNIEAVEERASGRVAAGIGLDRVGDNSLLKFESVCS